MKGRGAIQKTESPINEQLHIKVKFSWNQRESTVDKEFALHVATPGSMPKSNMDPQANTGVTPAYRTKSNPWASLDVASKQTTKQKINVQWWVISKFYTKI